MWWFFLLILIVLVPIALILWVLLWDSAASGQSWP